MSPNLSTLRRAFVDVCRGYSVGRYGEQTVYIRHLGHFGHAEFDSLQATYEEEAKIKGALTEAQTLDKLSKDGSWTPTRETDILRQRDFIARMEEGRKTIAVPSILRNHEEHIGREKAKLTGMLTDRAKIVGTTAEIYAQRRLDDHYMVSNLFVDAGLTVALLTSDTFDNLDETEVDAIHETYRSAIESCSETNLRRLAVQDFFMSYYVLCADDPARLFGQPVCELSYYQVRLLNQARYWRSLLDNTDLNRLPPEKRGDPDAIESLHISQRNMAALQAEGKAPVGMSASDIKETGQHFHQPPPPGLSGNELIKWMQRQQVMAPR